MLEGRGAEVIVMVARARREEEGFDQGHLVGRDFIVGRAISWTKG